MNRRTINVIKRRHETNDATDIALLVSTSSKSEINIWDKTKIADSLIKETGASSELAHQIAETVERKIYESGFGEITTSMIRELIDIELLDRGLSIIHKKHTSLGLPMYDLEQIILNANKENSNTTHNPESINLTIAEAILKEFALRKVFSEDVALAHLIGDIHLHDLGFIVRPYCGGHSLEYIKKYGLALPNITSTSRPAKHPEVLIGHMVKMASSLQSHYAGAVGWEAVNVFFAPYLVGLPYERIKQLAQMLIYEFNQLAGARGSQVTFTDFNLYYNVPKHFRETKAIGPGGEYTGKTYKEYEKEAQMFLRGMFEIYLEGDATSKTFVFPKPLLHINRDFFEAKDHEEFLDLASKVASKQGITYFVFDRGDEVTVSQCLHPSTKILADVDGKLFYGTIEDLCGRQIGWREASNISITTPVGEAKKVKEIYSRLETRKLLSLTLKDGSCMKATLDHPMLVWDKNLGEIIVKEADELVVGDLVPAAKSINVNGEKSEVDLVEEAFAQGIELQIEGVAKQVNEPESLSKKYNLPYLEMDKYIKANRIPIGIVVGEELNYENEKIVFGAEENALVPAIVKLDPDFGQFLGIFTAAGYVEDMQLRFYFRPESFEYAEWLEDFLAGFGKIRITKNEKNKEVVLGCSSRSLVWLVEQFIEGNSIEEKHLKGLAFNANKHFRMSFLRSYLEVYTGLRDRLKLVDRLLVSSREFADDIRVLMKTLGINSIISSVFEEKGSMSKQEIVFSIKELTKLGYTSRAGSSPDDCIWRENGANEDYAYLPIVSIEAEDYFGLVYDFEMVEEPQFHLANGVLTHNCCRLKLKLNEEDLEETKTPERMRFSALQNVTVNLPRIAYKAQGNDELLFAELNRSLELVGKAHLQKKAFIASLLELGKDGPLAILSDSRDGEPYIRLNRLTYLTGLLGLNEMVQMHTGKQIHESDEALRFGLKVISHMNIKCKQISNDNGIKMVLEESPAESSGYRLAKLDMKYFPNQTKKVIKGGLGSDEYYYTNSVHVAVDAPLDYIDRVQKQSLFHPLIEAGSIVHVWLGEHEPPPESIKNFVVKTFKNTHCAQLAFSPEFTVCNDCRRTSRGLQEICPLCESDDVYGITRIVGYFSKIPTWNRGKTGELKDRIRTNLEGRNGKSEAFLERELSQVSGSQSGNC